MISADLPQIADLKEHNLAALILQRIRTGSRFDLPYLGGSEREKHPRLFARYDQMRQLSGIIADIVRVNGIHGLRQ